MTPTDNKNKNLHRSKKNQYFELALSAELKITLHQFQNRNGPFLHEVSVQNSENNFYEAALTMAAHNGPRQWPQLLVVILKTEPVFFFSLGRQNQNFEFAFSNIDSLVLSKPLVQLLVIP